MKIGALSAVTGVSARSLRYYEQQGLLRSERTPGGQREYASEAPDRVHLITSLLAAGLSTKAIDDVLPCMTQVAIRTPALSARLRDELQRIDDQLVALGQTRILLAELVSRYS